MLLLASPASAAALRLGGWLEWTPDSARRWPVAGALEFPVGDRFDLSEPESGAANGYSILRSVRAGTDSTSRHDGCDLGNGHAGGSVRAIGNGLVIKGAGDDWQEGYGFYLAIAHQLSDGTLAYSVYAHLRRGSVRVRAGESVRAGQRIARVGRTGRATTDHLHFELRLPRDPDDRWEHASVVDPVEFVRDRLPEHRTESGWARESLIWAEESALLLPDDRADATLRRGQWWRMLAAVEFGSEPHSRQPDSLRSRLIESGVLSEASPASAHAALDWKEFSESVHRVSPSFFIASADSMREICAEQLGWAAPGARASKRDPRGEHPNLAQAALALASSSERTLPARPSAARRGRRRPRAR